MSEVSKYRRIVAFLLCSTIVGAFLGMHRFYIGKNQSGIAMFLLFTFSTTVMSYMIVHDEKDDNAVSILAIICFIALCGWVIVDWFKILLGKFKDKDGNYIKKW